VPLPLGLHLQEGHERPDLFLDGLEPDQGVELRLELREGPRGLWPPKLVRDPVAGIRRPGRLRQALAQNPQAAGHVLEWISSHG
jgi:hypothetical protein